MADTRIFKVTGASRRIVNRTALAGIVAYARTHKYGSWRHGKPVKIEATNAEATDGWADVTSEFLG